MLPVGALIWISVRPLLRTLLIISAGFTITKLDLFPPAASRGAGQMLLNFIMPCLLFSHIVPAFNSDNVKAIGPLVAVALIYFFVGCLMALIIKRVFWVPHRFRHGLIVAGAWANVGDIPTALALGITASEPFNGTQDQNLSVAYISVFILVFFVTLFPLGGHLIVKKDYDGPDIETGEVIKALLSSRQKLCRTPALIIRRILGFSEGETDEECKIEGFSMEHQLSDRPDITVETNLDKVSSTQAATSSVEESPQVLATISLREYSRPAIESRAKHFLYELVRPTPFTILVSLPIALVDPLKALFVPTSDTFRPSFHPIAPDGAPPLAFILDTATFAGNASVPVGLICIGSALARLQAGKARERANWPRGAIISLAVGKMILMPVVGAGIVAGLVNCDLLNKEDKVLQLVCLLMSGLPTATSQVYLTQVYNPTGSAEHLAAFLIPQYLIVFFSMTALTVYTLSYIS